MNKQIRFAVLIPCFNAAEYLPDLFETIRLQTRKFDEIICYDDCSSDNTAEVAATLGATVIVGKVNKGAAFARNQLINATTADWIHFHDADDLLHTEYLEKISNAITDEHTQILTNIEVADKVTKQVIGYSWYKGLNTTADQLEFFLRNVGLASMGLYHIDAVKAIGGFWDELRGNEDPDFHIRMAAAGYNFRTVDEVLIYKREHSTSFSSQNWLRCNIDKLKCIEKYMQMLDKKYYPIIGQETAQLTNYFYREGDIADSKKARCLTYKLGVKYLENSKLSQVISKVLGLPFYFWIYRVRKNLNLIKR